MLKNVIFAILQFILFLVVALAGLALPALHVIPSHIMKFGGGTRGIEWDGVLLMLALLVVILIIEAARRRLRCAAPWTLLAFVLAAIAALKLGIRDL